MAEERNPPGRRPRGPTPKTAPFDDSITLHPDQSDPPLIAEVALPIRAVTKFTDRTRASALGVTARERVSPPVLNQPEVAVGTSRDLSMAAASLDLAHLHRLATEYVACYVFLAMRRHTDRVVQDPTASATASASWATQPVRPDNTTTLGDLLRDLNLIGLALQLPTVSDPLNAPSPDAVERLRGFGVDIIGALRPVSTLRATRTDVTAFAVRIDFPIDPQLAKAKNQTIQDALGAANRLEGTVDIPMDEFGNLDWEGIRKRVLAQYAGSATTDAPMLGWFTKLKKD